MARAEIDLCVYSDSVLALGKDSLRCNVVSNFMELLKQRYLNLRANAAGNFFELGGGLNMHKFLFSKAWSRL
jgi:hypothetical protein